MGKEMVVSADRHETRVALLEDDQVVEVYFQRAQEYSLAGSIHKGRVTRVLPGMQSAFVNLGLERDTFLYVSDFFEEHEEFADEKPRGGSGDGESRPEGRGDRGERGDRGDRGDRGGRGRDRRERFSSGRPAPAGEAAPVEELKAEINPFAVAPLVANESAAAGPVSAGEDDRRRRRRRGRGRSGFPDSKFSAPVTDDSDEALPAAEGDAGDEVEAASEPSEVILLPGESLRKYSQLKAAPREEAPTALSPLRFVDDAPAPADAAEPEAEFDEAEDSDIEDAVAEVAEEVRVIDTGLTDEEAALDEIQELAEAALDRDASVLESTSAPLEVSEEAEDLAPVAEADDEDEEGDEAASEVLPGEAVEDGSEPALPLAGFSAHVRSPEQGRFLQQRAPGSGRRGRRRGRRGRGERPAPEANGAAIAGAAPAVAPAAVVAPSPEGELLETGRPDFDVADPSEVSFRAEMEMGAAPALAPETDEATPLETERQELGRLEGEIRAPRGDRPERSDRGDRNGRDRGRGRGRGDRGGERGGDRGGERGGEREARSEGRGDRQRPPLPSISDLLKEGQEILVQIAKEPLGQKGARITSHIALPGRYCVYMPTVNHTGVSRKIESDAERHRLKQILVANTEGIPGGFICRTAGEGRSEQEIAQDITYLHNLWLEIKRKADAKPAPALLYHDVEIVERILRDQLTDDFKAIWIDNEDVYEQVLRFVQRLQPNLVNRVKMFTRPVPIFDFFNITTELEKALKPKVWLKSGGFIVINQTEALVAIDINTGKYVGKTNRLEDTIAKTNVEAVKEIVRQIRLRDLGGIIVIDFIDMDERKNRQKVMQALEDAMRVDKAPYKILQFNDFGLVAITRKRVKQSLERTLCMPCPHCEGAGYVKSVHTVIVEIVGESRKMARSLRDNKDVELRVHPDVAKELKSSGNSYLEEIEEILGLPVAIVSDPTIHHEKFSLA